jgi:tetratricopeptide (TPR) repeat protein
LLPLAVGLGVRQSVVSQRVVCTGGEDQLAGAWELHAPDRPEGARESQIHSAFMRTGKSYAADVYETVSRALTRYAHGWSRMYRDTCEATNLRHEQSDEVLDLRMSCLRGRLAGFRALTDVFADATGEVVENAVPATNALATLDGCADVPTLRAVIRPPNDQQTVSKVAQMRLRLAETKARFDAGRWKEMGKGATQMVSDARAIGYQPLLAEVLSFVGQVQAKRNEADAAEKTLIEAYRLADASRHDEVRADAATNLVFVIGDMEGQLNDALRWSQAATAVLQRLGGHDLLRSWQLNNLGCAYTVHHQVREAIEALQEALALKAQLLGGDDPDVAISEGNLALVLAGGGRYPEALAHVDRAIEIQEKKLGPAHPALFPPLSNRGEILNALGRPTDAIASFGRAIALWEREVGTSPPVLAYALTGLGIAYLNQNKPTNAILPLERAVLVRGKEAVDPGDRAQTVFALARALGESGREHERARRLAEEARDAYAKSGMTRELETVENWLRGRAAI